MSTYTQILYQIVFTTKSRERTLTKEGRQKMYQYITGILKGKKCHLYQINGVEDHIHIVTHIHPTQSLSNLVKDIKLATSDFIKQRELFSKFNGWQAGYGAFTYSMDALDQLIEYVKMQEVHHQKKDFLQEYIALLNEHGVDYNEKYLL